MSEGHRAILTETIPALRSGSWRLRRWRVTRVLERPPTRIVFYRVGYHRRGDRGLRTVQVVAKLYGDDTGPQALATLRELRRAGFRPPAPHQVPRPYGYVAARRALVQQRVPGVVWADLLRADPAALAVASAGAAAWLVRLQHCSANAGLAGATGDRTALEGRVAELLSSFPAHGARLRPLAEQLLARLGCAARPGVPSHGDFHPENVFVAPGTITVVDVDRLAVREPAFDVGYALGQLLAMSYVTLGDLAPGARAAAAFWRRYQGEGKARWPRVAVHAARGLLQSLYWELCALPRRRTDLLTLWADLIERWLESETPATLDQLCDHRSR